MSSSGVPPVHDASLAGADVIGADGALVGRVRDIYRADRTGSLRALCVVMGRFSSRAVLLPLAAVDVSSLAGAGQDGADPVRLLIDAETARAGLAPDPTGHASVELLERAARELGIEEAALG